MIISGYVSTLLLQYSEATMVLITSLGRPLALGVQLGLVTARVVPFGSSTQPISLQLPNMNFTESIFQTNHLLNMTRFKDDTEITYRIRDTTTTLAIIGDTDTPLLPSNTAWCLGELLTFAQKESKQESEALKALHKVFWFHPPEAKVRIGFLPPIYPVYGSYLTWKDVIIIVDGLLEYFTASKQWQEITFYIYDDKRGALGSGSVTRYERSNGDASSTATWR